MDTSSTDSTDAASLQVCTRTCAGLFVRCSPICIVAVLLFLLASCAPSSSSGQISILPQSTRPVVKIGLIAPFEGLYRRTGYESLPAAQMAIADHNALIRESGVDLLIQALDDGARPERSLRAAQKLLVDPGVNAIVGPLSPWVFENDPLAENGGEWSLILTDSTDQGKPRSEPRPFFLFPWMQPSLWGGADDEALSGDPFSQNELILAVAKAVAEEGIDRLLVSGSSVKALSESALITVAMWTDEISIDETDAILWLGDAADGTALLNGLRDEGWAAPFWFGPWGGDPIVRERTNTRHGIYWAIWQDSHYTSWSESHEPSSPFAYLVYRATEHTIGKVLNIETNSAPSSLDGGGWEVAFYAIGEDGLSYRIDP